MEAWCNLIAQLPFDWAQYVFMQHALLAILLISPVFAMLGCLVVNNRMAFFSEAIGHAALTGVAIGVLFGFREPLWAMLGFAVLLALSIAFLRRYSASSTDTAIGLCMSFTVALGVVLLSHDGGFGKYSRYLIGDLLTINPAELKGVALLLFAIAAVWVVLFNQMFLVSINQSLARSRGIRVWRMEMIFSVVVALAVTMSIPWIGLLVINSLLILPAAASRNISCTTAQYILGSVAISLVSGLAGLISSFYWDTATGATVVLYLMAVFMLSLLKRTR